MAAKQPDGLGASISCWCPPVVNRPHAARSPQLSPCIISQNEHLTSGAEGSNMRAAAAAPTPCPHHRVLLPRTALRQPQPPCASLSRRALIGAPLVSCCGGGCGCKRSQWYDRYFAFNMAHGMEEYESAVAGVKRALFQQLLDPAAQSSSSSSVLEVGMGTGPNLAYLQEQEKEQLCITGVEPNAEMWAYARASAAAAGLQASQLQLIAANAEQLLFAADSFDAAVITLVLCSLPDPSRALAEVARVLKPGGRLLLVEHVLAPAPGWQQLQQRLLDPLQQLLADGCHLTRDTAAAVRSSPLEVLDLELGQQQQHDGPFSSIRWTPPAPGGQDGLLRFEVAGIGLIAPHVAGILRKPVSDAAAAGA